MVALPFDPELTPLEVEVELSENWLTAVEPVGALEEVEL